MSILKTTHTGSKALSVTSKQYIIDEIAKLGYTYNYDLRCWSCTIPNTPHLIIRKNSFSFTIYVYDEIIHTKSYAIKSMYGLFNFIKDLKSICQS